MTLNWDANRFLPTESNDYGNAEYLLENLPHEDHENVVN